MFLLAVTLLCLWFGRQAQLARQQRELVQWVQTTGGFVRLDWQIDEDGKFDPNLKHPAPQWMREAVGDEYFQEVVQVAVGDPALSDLSPLESARSVEDLFIGSEKIDDLTPLSNLQQLRRLQLSVTKIGSTQPVLALRNLEELEIRHGSISDGDFELLRNGLRSCRVTYSYAGGAGPPIPIPVR